MLVFSDLMSQRSSSSNLLSTVEYLESKKGSANFVPRGESQYHVQKAKGNISEGERKYILFRIDSLSRSLDQKG